MTEEPESPTKPKMPGIQRLLFRSFACARANSSCFRKIFYFEFWSKSIEYRFKWICPDHYRIRTGNSNRYSSGGIFSRKFSFEVAILPRKKLSEQLSLALEVGKKTYIRSFVGQKVTSNHFRWFCGESKNFRSGILVISAEIPGEAEISVTNTENSLTTVYELTVQEVWKVWRNERRKQIRRNNGQEEDSRNHGRKFF